MKQFGVTSAVHGGGKRPTGAKDSARGSLAKKKQEEQAQRGVILAGDHQAYSRSGLLAE